jgi:hypothetical protein
MLGAALVAAMLLWGGGSVPMALADDDGSGYVSAVTGSPDMPGALADASGAAGDRGDDGYHDDDHGDDHDDDHDEHEDDILTQYYQHYDERYGNGKGPEYAVQRLVQQRDIQIPYEYVEMLMRIPNAFGEGAACVLCHSSNDPEHSYRGLDLSTCEGIRRGATEPPARAMFEPGNAEDSRLHRHLRNNRMPFGVPFDAPTDTANIRAVKAWIDSGAPDDDFFRQKVLPLFKDRTAFGGFQACTECHLSNQEPPSFHELDLTSYEGIMLGADSVAKAEEGLPPVPIVFPGDAAGSPLYQRLVENRMPAGIEPSENRDHPNIQILMQWIDQGAPCD